MNLFNMTKRLAVLLVALSMLLTSPAFSFMTYATGDQSANAPASEQQDAPADEKNADAPKEDPAPAEEKADAPQEDPAPAEEKADASKENPVPAEENVDAPKENPAPAEEGADEGVLEVSSPVGSYTVDFYFTAEDGTETEYHLKGGTSIMLSELFEKLGINRDTADIKETVFTDNELVRFEKVGDDYKVISLKPFNTEESLIITFEDDEVIVLRVEDEVSPTELGSIIWEITKDGVLKIRPKTSGTPGVIPNQNSGTADPPINLSNTYPWLADANAEQIKEIVIEDGVTTDSQGRYMFYNLPNLTKADLSNLDANNLGVVNDMFKSCPKLQEVTFPANFGPKQFSRMFQNCAELTTINFGTEEKPFNLSTLTRTSNMNPFETQATGNNAPFTGCSKLTTLNMPGANLSDTKATYISNFTTAFGAANTLAKTFNLDGATIGGGTNTSPARTMFKVDTLDTLSLKNATINERLLRTIFHNFDSNYNISNYNACKGLKVVDMTGAKFPITALDNEELTNNNNCTAQQMFQGNNDKTMGLGKLETVILKDADFGTTETFNQMFRNTPSLQKVDMSGDVNMKAVRMVEMFNNCAAEEIDLSGIGVLDQVITMENCFKGAKVKILNISKLDNSVIKPINKNHKPKDEDDPIGSAAKRNPSEANAPDWNRDLALDTCTSLEWLIADGSSVWMTTNNKGRSDDQYFNAATELDNNGNETKFYYFTEKQMDLYKTKPANLDEPGAATEKIETRRDYIDVMTDRTTLPDGSQGPDYNTNVNTEHGNGHINAIEGQDKDRAGLLAPVTYHLLDETWDKVEPPYQETYYYIDDASLSASPANLDYYNDTLLYDGSYTISTKPKTKEEWLTQGDNKYVLQDDNNPLVILTYEDAVMDINGNLHDLVVKINKVTFTNLDKIIDRPAGRSHDGNKYVDDYTTYYRDILSYSTGMLQLKNYARGGNPEVEQGSAIIKGDAGADIDFTIEVKDALPNTSILFYIDDMDIPAFQAYQYPNTDACYDNLPWIYTEANSTANPPIEESGISYDDHSEGIVLREGNDIDTLMFPDHNGLKKETKTVNGQTYIYIHGTGSDPSAKSDTNRGSTGWSAFSVKADATRSNYTWTNGIGCTTDILNPTRGTTFDPVKIKPDAFKSVNNAIPSGDYEKGFTFQMRKATEVSEVPFEIDGFPVKKTASGQMYFKDGEEDYYAVVGYCKSVKLTQGEGGFNPLGVDPVVKLQNLVENSFYNERKNDADLIDFGEWQYDHPGADGARAYVYRIQEKVESAEGDVLTYNTDHVTYFMKVIVTNPGSDIEMEKGIKAEVTIGRHYNRCTEEEWKTTWNDEIDPNEIVWDDWSQVVWSLDADEKGARWQEDLKIYYPQRTGNNPVLYTVKRDKNNVEYIAVPANLVPNAETKTGTVYLDANNPYIALDPDSHTSPSVLVETEEGDVYPYSEQTDPDWRAEHHPDKELSKPLIVDGKDVREDVHGQMHIKDGSDYYAVVPNGDVYEKGSKLTVKDGVFNPDSNYDKQVHVPWKVNGAQVMVDFAGQKYYKTGNKDYRDPGDDPENPTSAQLRLGKAGKVLPKSTDENVTHDKTGGAILIVNDNEDQPQKVYITDKGALYYKKGDKYYSVMNTLLTPGVDEFDPKTSDNLYETDFDIMEDGDGTFYYRSDGAYYIYAPEDPTKNGQPYTPSDPGDVDHTVIDIGYFKNKVKESSIIVKKKVVDSAGTEVTDDRSGVFDYIIEFKNNAGEPTNFTPTDYQFSPAAPTTFEKIGTGKFKFQLTEGQQVQIYGVPFNITYTVSEPISDEDGKELNLNGWEFVQLDGTEQYDPADPNKKTPETLKVRSVTRKVLTEDVSYHTHTFTNRFTEVIVDKEVNDAPTGEKDKEFSFKAMVDVNLGTDRGGQSFSYGTMQQAESDVFKMETTNADGKASVEIEFTLKADEDIALVVPQGSKVVVTEKAEKNYITKVSGEYPTKEEAKASKIELAADECKNMPQPKLHFKNIYIPPVEKQLGVEKILKGRAWRDSDKFDMAILSLDNAPLPDHATVKDDLVYLEAVVSNDDEPVMDSHDPTKLEGYKAHFEKNAWHIGDFRKDDGTFEIEKTFKYNVRELTAAESGLPRIPGVTYSSEEYRIEVTVEVENADTDKPSLVIKSFKVYKMNGTGTSATLGEEVVIPVFTNVYDAHETTYKFEAVKDYADSQGNTVDHVTGEYQFVIKPFGRYETIAPMPMGKDVNGNTPGQTGEGREFVATNESDGDIEFRDATYLPMDDGFRFNYDEIIEHLIEHRMAEQSISYAEAAAQIDEELHSDTGIDFEYEIYEVIPDAGTGETKVNNDDGTWSIIDDATGDEEIFDGIHHTRMIRLKVVDKPTERAKDDSDNNKTIDVGGVTYDVYVDVAEVEFYTKDSITYKAEDNSPYTPIVNLLVVEGHGDDHKQDFYYDKNGEEQIAADNIENYDEIHHVRTGDGHDHFDDGAPIFLNYHFEQEKADLVLKKNWDDEDDRDEIRPDSVTVNVKSDRGIRIDKDVAVAGTTWKTTEKDLPVWRFDREAYYAALQITDSDERKEALKNCRTEIKYTITEKPDSSITGDENKAYKTEDYNVSTDPDKKNPNHVTVTLDPNATKELEVTVTNKHVPAPGKIIGDETYGLKGDKQTGKPNYKGNPNNPVTPKNLVKPEKPGATISGDGKTVIIPGEGTYKLNNDGTITFTPEKDFVGDPTPIEVEGEDETGNTVKGTYTPHVIDPEESVEVKRIIKFTYERKDGTPVTDSITQTGTITRKALEVDPKTGKVTKWGPWTSWTFPAVKNPDAEAGPEWATKDIAGELTVNGPQADIPVEYIVYHKAESGETPKDCPDCNNEKGGVKTGDETNVALWIGLLLAAVVAVGAVIIRRKRRDN